ncbi:TPA: hypothetical protein DDW35_12525 [Candidatus Sumerlaeota bacterium]|jgi:hypothetical protein|nr:hypothetical protein [Candidatus Sumerlaeota bacterium]
MASNEIAGVSAVSQGSTTSRYAQQLTDELAKKAAEAQQRAGREEALETQSAKAAEASGSSASSTEQGEQQESRINLTA